MLKTKFITLIILLFSAFYTKGQKNDVIVEISGVVVSNDSLKQLLPNTYILIKKRNQVSISNKEGFFSFVALAGDTVVFSHVGFKDQKLWVPDTLDKNTYLTMVILKWEIEYLEPVIVYPWPLPEDFKKEFLAMKIPTTEFDIAQRNLAIQELKDQAMAMGYDAAEMQDYMIGLQNQALYNSGRYYGQDGGAAILGAITNPFAWAQFFDALKRGDFKSKK